MAITKNGIIRGSIAHLVYRGLDGNQVVQSKPGPGLTAMSAVTLGYASRFSTASALALHIRESFQKSINGFYDGKMVGRLTKQVWQIMNQGRQVEPVTFEKNSFSALSGFEFNLKSPLRAQTGFQLSSRMDHENLLVTIPEFPIGTQLKFPAGSNRCELTVSLALIRLADGCRLQYPQRRSVSISRQDEIQEATELRFALPAGCLYILTMGLRYTALRGNLEQLINTKDFNPVAILEAETTAGEYGGADGLDWIDMPYVKIN